MKKYALLFFLLLNSILISSGLAQVKYDATTWKVTCKLPKSTVELQGTSKSGDITNDDMNIMIKGVRLQTAPAWFTMVRPSKKFGICDNTIGVITNSGNLLLLLGKNERPYADSLFGVLINPQTSEIIDILPKIGVSAVNSDAFSEVQLVPHGLRIKLSQGWKKEAQTDGPENRHLAWLKLTAEASTIEARWETPVPTAHYPNTSSAYIPGK